MKLYYTPGACSLAAHIVGEEAGLGLKLEKVDLKTHKTADGSDYYAVNPKGYVPALALDDGGTLTENIAILNYLADRSGEKLHTPRHGTLERYRLEEWLGFITTELHKSFGPLFQGGGDDERNKAKQKILHRLKHVEERLTEPFLLGERMSVADAYLFVILTWSTKMHLDLSPYPRLNAFFARMNERDSVKRALAAEAGAT
ncbi:MAG: glutathione transferase GstA [Alphaproteobacteria bacterium]|nr:glutathione transferase GstA [Alphaproteobacteria bacterium]